MKNPGYTCDNCTYASADPSRWFMIWTQPSLEGSEIIIRKWDAEAIGTGEKHAHSPECMAEMARVSARDMFYQNLPAREQVSHI